MALDEKLTTCPNCGAARVPGVVVCGYCDHPLVDDLEKVAIPCWSCKTWNELEQRSCTRCGSSLWVPCLECANESPHHTGSCIHCGARY